LMLADGTSDLLMADGSSGLALTIYTPTVFFGEAVLPASSGFTATGRVLTKMAALLPAVSTFSSAARVVWTPIPDSTSYVDISAVAVKNLDVWQPAHDGRIIVSIAVVSVTAMPVFTIQFDGVEKVAWGEQVGNVASASSGDLFLWTGVFPALEPAAVPALPITMRIELLGGYLWGCSQVTWYHATASRPEGVTAGTTGVPSGGSWDALDDGTNTVEVVFCDGTNLARPGNVSGFKPWVDEWFGDPTQECMVASRPVVAVGAQPASVWVNSPVSNWVCHRWTLNGVLDKHEWPEMDVPFGSGRVGL